MIKITPESISIIPKTILGVSVSWKNKIPKNVLENLKNDKDNNYYFKFDKNKGLFEQNYMTETKALIVELYEKYLAPEEELVLWKKYNYLCNNKEVENEK